MLILGDIRREQHAESLTLTWIRIRARHIGWGGQLELLDQRLHALLLLFGT